MKIKELLDSKDKWCKGYISLDDEDNYVDVDSIKAVKWCLLGALIKCYQGDHNFSSIRDRLLNNVHYLGHKNMVTFNDLLGYESVIKLVTDLDI